MESNKKTKKIIKKKIKFKGKNVYYTNVINLSKKLNITKAQAKQLISDIKTGNTTQYIHQTNGNIAKYNIQDKPLLFKSFGVNKISNKKFINATSSSVVKKNINISKTLPTNIEYNLNIYVKFEAKISEKITTREYTSNQSIEISQLTNEYIQDMINAEYLSTVSNMISNLKILDVQISSMFTKQKFKWDGTKLYHSTSHLKISNLFNEVIENTSWKDCVRDYLKFIYPKLSKKKIDSLRTIGDIKLWAVNNNIKMLCYNINGKIIESNYPIKKNKIKNLVFIAYNNHLYPLKNSTLNRVKLPEKINLIFIENGIEKVIDFLKDGVLPTGIFYQYNDIKSFIVNDNKYIVNPDYDECLKLLESFGLKDKMTPITNWKSIHTALEQLYVKENVKSFFPQSKKFIKGGFNYNSEKNLNNDLDDELCTIDKNKCYSYILSCLEYLLVTNIKCMRWIKKPKQINSKYYLYIVKPKNSSILLPNLNIYTGEFLLYCKNEGLDYDLLEELECVKKDNYYNKLITELYKKVESKKLTQDNFKTIINVMIGKFEKSDEIQLNEKVIKICNKDETDHSEGFVKELNDEYNLILENKEKFNLYNKKPISVQIKDNSRKEIYEMMKKLKLNNDDIVQVKTDSITFKKNKTNFEKYINKSLDGWKIENYVKIEDTDFYNNENLSFMCHKNNENYLADCYAGCGKTYNIINELIKNLDNYIVLTPSHSTLKEYRLKGINCNVIQKYSLSDTIPNEQNIIIDEIGMIDNYGFDVIYKCFLKNRSIYGYGDFKQLKAVDGSINNSKIFINYIFKHQEKILTNYRNNFSSDFYNKIIETKDKDQLIKYMKKYRSDTYYNADTIICYRNETRKKYNMLMCAKLKIKNLYSAGACIISKTNNLKDKNIYNKFCYTVINNKNAEHVEISDGIDKIVLTRLEIEKNFDFAYARTLYSVQGETLHSFYYPDEDLFFLDGRTTYTLISRLKFELEQPQIEQNTKYENQRKTVNKWKKLFKKTF